MSARTRSSAFALTNAIRQLSGSGRNTQSAAQGSAASPWLDVKAAGAYVGFCEKTIRRACATGGLRCVRMGRSIRIQRAWLDAWLLAQHT